MKNISAISNFSVVRFFTEVRDELKKVSWPNRNETVRLTTIVIVASLIVGIFIGGLDFVFTNVFSAIFKLK